MASDIARRTVAKFRSFMESDDFRRWMADGSSVLLDELIDDAIRASHAQRTRRENEALARLADKGWKTLSIAGMQQALRRARRGSK